DYLHGRNDSFGRISPRPHGHTSGNPDFYHPMDWHWASSTDPYLARQYWRSCSPDRISLPDLPDMDFAKSAMYRSYHEPLCWPAVQGEPFSTQLVLPTSASSRCRKIHRSKSGGVQDIRSAGVY